MKEEPGNESTADRNGVKCSCTPHSTALFSLWTESRTGAPELCHCLPLCSRLSSAFPQDRKISPPGRRTSCDFISWYSQGCLSSAHSNDCSHIHSQTPRGYCPWDSGTETCDCSTAQVHICTAAALHSCTTAELHNCSTAALLPQCPGPGDVAGGKHLGEARGAAENTLQAPGQGQHMERLQDCRLPLQGDLCISAGSSLRAVEQNPRARCCFEGLCCSTANFL